MKLAISTIAYREERFIVPFIQHYQNKVDEILVLNTSKPWNGDSNDRDRTAAIANSLGATVITYPWKSEEEQRNAGQDYLSDFDYVLVIDPDEYFSNADFEHLLQFLEDGDPEAVIVAGQYTYWKDGFVADPARDYKQLVAVKPTVRFVDKRVVGTGYVEAPVWLHHFSWAKTDDEVLRKITHYAHSGDFNIKEWYENVWLRWQPGMTDVHPTTPDTLHNLIPANLPFEIERLGLWPTKEQK